MAPAADLDLLALQGNIRRDPDSYAQEFDLQFRHYKACLDVFNLKPSEDSKQFGELIMFIAQVSSCYPEKTQSFVPDIVGLLERHYAILNSAFRQTLVKCLILYRNRNQIAALELLPTFFTLFRCQDKALRQMIFRHIIADVKQANRKGQNRQFNRAVQNYFYSVLEDSHEAAAKKSLAVLIELWRRQVWRDARTVNVIAKAALHKSTMIMMASMKFFLGQDERDPDDSDDEEDDTVKLVNPSKAEVYKATKKGTASSKKKKAAKLKRVMSAVKKQQRKSTRNFENFAAIQLLHDPQSIISVPRHLRSENGFAAEFDIYMQNFAEELYKRLNKSQGEKFEVRMAMMGLISRVIGVHKLLLLNFYPFMQKYVLPHQRDAPQILATLVQAVHDEIPPDTLQPVMRQLVDQFVHDRARPEVMTLGLKTIRTLCERAPLVMTSELLQDLVLYKKFREKEVASAARSLITLFRELAPAMLEKRDRGRDADLKAGPRAFGSKTPMTRVQGAELLQHAELNGDSDVDSELDGDNEVDEISDDEASERPEDSDTHKNHAGELSDLEDRESEGNDAVDLDEEIGSENDNNSHSEEEDLEIDSAQEEGGEEKLDDEDNDGETKEESSSDLADDSNQEAKSIQESPKSEIEDDKLKSSLADVKRKKPESDSLSSMKKQLAEARSLKRAKSDQQSDTPKEDPDTPLEYQRILTEEDFERIRELRHKKMVADLMRKHGLKSAAKQERLLAAAEDEAEEALDAQDLRAAIGEERIVPGTLTGRHKTRQSKEERLAKVMEGREGRLFGAAAARKNKKVGGKSNKEKLKQKNLPMGAKKHIVHRRAGRQKVGKKNFKGHARR